MRKSDLKAIIIIGVLVGVLVQPILSNLLPSITNTERLAVFVGLAILAPVVLYAAYLLGKIWSVLYQFTKFAAVGALNTMIDFGVLNLEIFLSGVYGGATYSLFKAISFLCSTTNSFFWNKYWTFGVGDKATAGEAAKFYIVAVVGWALNVSTASVVVNALTKPTSISPAGWANIGALAGVAASFLWDFIGYKFIVFKKPAATN